ncbi:MAG: hypothetical protein FWF77_02080 [Defluviitaleaceae bacterium]|nr:hypothetical protein [Defluviitaleaceae bacterium]
MQCGLLGQKLAHSYSPAIHAEFGGYDYELFELEPQDLASFFAKKNFHGINVTIPYKQDAMRFCDELSPAAKEIGSVNTILKRGDGTLFGDNTDAAGFAKMIEILNDGADPTAPPTCAAHERTTLPLNKKARQARIGHRGHVSAAARSLEAGSSFPAHKKARQARSGHRGRMSEAAHALAAGSNFPAYKKVIILGSGGSSLSVAYVMKELGAREIIVVPIEDNRAEFLRGHGDAEILVNCTPVGMYPNVGASPVSLDFFPELRGVLDLVYNPARTWLMMDAAERGIPTVGGLVMLVGQAAVSSQIFTGREVGNESNVLEKLRREMENIILIGMPGSGKSTHARILAEKLGKKFVDSDDEIVRADGRTIPEIFEAEGEAGFRAKETAVLAQFGKESALVIATGGGCITREENYRHLHQNGTIIFGERDIEALCKYDRPLSQGDLHALYKTRLPLYKRFADIIVDTNCGPDEAVARILLQERQA